METKKLPKIVFTLSLISFCITAFWAVALHFSNLNVKILLALQPITFSFTWIFNVFFKKFKKDLLYNKYNSFLDYL